MLQPEQTVEVVRNGKGGTNSKRGSFGSMGKARLPLAGASIVSERSQMVCRVRERTAEAYVDGGALFGKPQERSPDPPGRAASAAFGQRVMARHGGARTARHGESLRGRAEGQEGSALSGRPDPGQAPPRGKHREVHLTTHSGGTNKAAE